MHADYHIHSSFSDDSTYPMEDIIKKAITIGLDEICFTEHVDHGVKSYDSDFYKDYHDEFLRCKGKYQNQIKIKFGIEYGIQTHTIEQYQQDFYRNDFDFVILSCHQINDMEFWTQDFQKGKTQKEYNLAYYEEIYQVMNKYKNYSVLGHLDAIKRDDLEGVYPYKETKDILENILKLAIKDGKGIEINTSNERYGLSDFTSCKDILLLYKQLGGEIITFGSDTHKEEHVGYHIKEMRKELKRLGFTKFCTYERMEPHFHEL